MNCLTNQFQYHQLTNLGVTGKFCNFSFSHSDDQSFPHSQFKLFAQDELHGFTAAPHGSGVIQHGALTQAGAVVKDHLIIKREIVLLPKRRKN